MFTGEEAKAAVPQLTADVKPGWKSSEFWLHLAAYVPAVLSVIIGAAHPLVIVAGAALAVVNAIHYGGSRADVKKAALDAAVAAAQAAADALQKKG